MNKSVFILTLFFSSVAFSQNENVNVFLEKWQNSKVYLLEIAKAMPEDKYDYKPTEREMTFAEQLIHIKGNMNWLSTSYFTGSTFDKKKTKKHIQKMKLF